LSRCRSLEGLLLRRPIRKSDIILDPLVLDYEHAFETWTNDVRKLVAAE
jgi:hypothetical protein